MRSSGQPSLFESSASTPAARPPRAAEPPAGSAESLAAILDDLDEQQRAAVTHGDGPLLVVAGAGTGKTRVITRRIAWLIATGRARPDQILALTYTEKAAAEMEGRVDVLLPYGLFGATIATFHAFCDRLLREHAIELGLTSQLRVETQAEILVFLREHILELGLSRYLPLGNPHEHLRDLLGLFDRARDEDLSPERYAAFAEALAEDAAGDEARDRAEAEREKARAFATYLRLLNEHGRVDFGAQLGLALRLLRERPYLRREYAERYRYILVDEFQDTNHVQFELVRLLAGERRNLTVVGDDDQSIYRFRGARIENLLSFPEAFPGGEVRVLTRNYRSGQSILDMAHRLIRFNDLERLEVRLGYDKRLISDRGIPGAVEHRVFGTGSDEADWVAGDIAQAIAAGTEPGEIAVLARSHFHLDPFALALNARGIRFRRVGLRGLYARPEVHLCLNVLRAIADPDDGAAVYMALGHPLFGADPVDLTRLGARARRHNRGLLAIACGLAEDPEGGLAEPTREAVLRFRELHRRLAAQAVQRPTSEVLYAFVSESGLLGRLAADEGPEAAEQVQNLNKLFGIVSRVGPLLRVDRVPQFMVHLDLLIEMGDDPAAAVIEQDENAVSLLTAHNAKGLEFPLVYLVQLADGRFPSYRRGERLPLPPELRRTADDPDDHYREERRLFFVGMTRAKDRLVLTQATDYGGLRPYKPSRFVAEALNLSRGGRRSPGPSAMESIQRHAPAPETPAPEIAPIPEDQELGLSHYQIDDYLTCPLKYRFAHVSQVPLQVDPRAMFGIAMHHAIKIFLRHRIKGIPVEPRDVLQAYEGAWRSEGFYSRRHEEMRFAEGQAALERFVERELAGGIVPLAVESEFRFRLGTNVISGRWDRIDERPEGIVLVDYKTSEVQDDEQADQKAQKSLEEGQLGLYALAYAQTRDEPPAAVELHFMDLGVVGRATVQPIHLERAAQRVHEAALGIRAAQFPPRPAQHRCVFCPYTRFCVHSAARGAAG